MTQQANNIDVAMVTWPNHPERLVYFTLCFERLKKNLSASRHSLRFVCSAETQQDPTRPWRGDDLEAYCRENDIALSWRDAPANLGANMNAAIHLCTAELILLQQDDWMLLYPLDLSPGAEFMLSNRGVDLLRYSWPDNERMRPTFTDDPSGWRRIDPLGKWPYGDDPHLRRRDFNDRWGWYLEGGRHGTASSTLLHLLAKGQADIRVADRCYYVHGGPVTSVLDDIRNRRDKR